MSTGFSAYHSVLGSALMRRVVGYRELWQAEHDGIESPQYEVMTGERMVLAVLVFAYLEALGNFLLSLNLDAVELKKVKGESLLDKWSDAPKRFIPLYKLGDEALSDIKSLLRRRNDIVHMQPQISVDGKKVHKGNAFMTSGKDHEVTLRWLSLPIRLVDQLQSQSHEIGFKFRFLSRVDELQGISQMFSETTP